MIASFSEWVAYRPRIIEDLRALGLGAFEQPGRGHVFEVEGRILAHQHRVEFAQLDVHPFDFSVPGVVVVGDDQAGRMAEHPAVAHAEAFAADREHFVAARSGRAHHRNAGVLVGFQARERVDDEGDFHAVATSTGAVCSSSTAPASKASRATTP